MKRAPLRSDPAKVRAWNDKHRGPLRSAGPLDGIRPPARKPPKRPDPIPSETRAAARARSGGKCIVCVHDGREHRRNGKAKADHLHHVFPKQRNRWPMLVAVQDNLVGVCADCHAAHEGASRRIPLEALPECVFLLAVQVGPAAVDYLLKTYAHPEPGGTPGSRTEGA